MLVITTSVRCSRACRLSEMRAISWCCAATAAATCRAPLVIQPSQKTALRRLASHTVIGRYLSAAGCGSLSSFRWWFGRAPQAQDGLADVVGLDVGGPTAKSQCPGEQDLPGPLGAIGMAGRIDRRARSGSERAAGTGHRPAKIGDLLDIAHAEQFADAAGRSRLGAGESLQRHPEAEQVDRAAVAHQGADGAERRLAGGGGHLKQFGHPGSECPRL